MDGRRDNLSGSVMSEIEQYKMDVFHAHSRKGEKNSKANHLPVSNKFRVDLPILISLARSCQSGNHGMRLPNYQ